MLELLRRAFVQRGDGSFVASALGSHLIFRMKAWPSLPAAGRTAEVYRMLSVMSSRPVSRKWLLSHCTMTPRELDALLRKLTAEGAVEVIDPSGFSPSHSPA
ncbi:hypothetical protein WG902_13090 [Ramlibacter sp. PS3R-8]|uniref:hypothetical protein n=1 Tax=Ramlibacter sp. PS3R-8 TaxID=3133437 RepID=UPI0030962C2A